MKRIFVLFLMFAFALPTYASTHKEQFNVSCKVLWAAVKDTLKNSGKYGIIGIDNEEMTASYNIGGNLTGKRQNSAVLNSTNGGAGCELQIQTAYSGLVNNDAGDFRKRVDESLARHANDQPATPAAAPAQQSQAQSPTPSTKASIAVESKPSGADIEIDGAYVGSTSSIIELSPGSHQVVIKKKGFADWSKTLTVTGGTIHLNAELEPAK
jgi:hypothetical protein